MFIKLNQQIDNQNPKGGENDHSTKSYLKVTNLIENNLTEKRLKTFFFFGKEIENLSKRMATRPGIVERGTVEQCN